MTRYGVAILGVAMLVTGCGDDGAGTDGQAGASSSGGQSESAGDDGQTDAGSAGADTGDSTTGSEPGECETDEDCIAMDDGDLCNGTLLCDTSGESPTCVVDPDSPVLCGDTASVCESALCDPETGDGAGILIQLPDKFLRREAVALGIELPAEGRYACGVVFVDRDRAEAARQIERFERIVAEAETTLKLLVP